VGIEKTFFMECDKCGSDLTDRDGTYTSGRSEWVEEHAEQAGWKYTQLSLGASPGWYCAACLAKSGRGGGA
jgi:hypothetical protein